MISPKYIHEMDHVSKFEETVIMDTNFFESCFDKLYFFENKKNDLDLFQEDTSVITEEATNIFAKIGEKVIAIVERVKKFIQETFDKLKQLFWEKKDDDKKLQELCRKNPDLANKLTTHLSEDVVKMKLHDSKDLKDFYSNMDKILEDIDRVENPETLKNRIKAARDKFESKADTLIKIGAVAGAALTISKLVVFIRDNKGKTEKSLEDMRNASEVQSKKLSVMAEALNKAKPEDLSKMRTKSTVLAYATQQYEQVTRGAVSTNTRARFALSRLIDTGIGIIGKGSADVVDKTKAELANKSADARKFAKSVSSDMKDIRGK